MVNIERLKMFTVFWCRSTLCCQILGPLSWFLTWLDRFHLSASYFQNWAQIPSQMPDPNQSCPDCGHFHTVKGWKTQMYWDQWWRYLGSPPKCYFQRFLRVMAPASRGNTHLEQAEDTNKTLLSFCSNIEKRQMFHSHSLIHLQSLGLFCTYN